MSAPRSRHYADLLVEMAERAPTAPVVLSSAGETSYEQLLDRASRVARRLAQLGVRRGDVVAVILSNRVEWLAATLGAHRLGATVAAFHTWVRPWDLEHMLSVSGAKVLITHDALKSQDYLALLDELVPELDRDGPGSWRSERFASLSAVTVVGEGGRRGTSSWAEWISDATEPLDPAPVPGRDASAADVAFVLYTSGSTARPKAVPMVHLACIENGFSIGERMALGPEDRVWLGAPLFWSYGSANAMTAAMTHGSALVLQPAFEPGEALELIARHRATAAYTLPNITASLVSHPSFDRAGVASLRTGLTIGLPHDVTRAARDLGIDGICNIYGSTETYGNCCVTPTDAPLERRLVSQGPPLPGVQLKICDPETGDELPVGQEGEIRVRGYVVDEYLGDPELTAGAFDADGYYRTGDLARLDADGWLVFAARATEMIKTGGINVSPLEVEEFLREHPDVDDAAVVGVPDPALDEVPVAFVVPVEGSGLTAQALTDHCREGIARFKVPARFELCDDLPKTETGKLDRRAMRRRGERVADATEATG